jgi:Amt family ammonium transporter
MLEVLPHTALLHCGLAMVVQPPPYLRIWWILCAILVFLMQVGFMLVETGFVRERSMSGIALKTFLMLLASSLAYSVIGYKIMYGSDIFHGLIGWDPSAHDLGMEWQFYQTGFAAVAATIISGAIAERTTLTINIIIALVIGGLIYPVAGHWAWATDGWLHSMGFHDLAGSGVVHFLGGIASATAAWIAGPRLDKYNPATKRIRGYVGERSLPLVSCGVLFLWLGWMGFNGGSVKNSDELENAGFYIVATGCAASAGGFAILLLSPLWDLVVNEAQKKGQRAFNEITRSVKGLLSKGALVRPFDILPATMGGMVAITANSDLLLPSSPVATSHSYLLAIPIGVCGGVAVFVTSKILRSDYIFRLGKIDDPAEAIAVHAGAGGAGILIAAFFSFHGVPVRLYTQSLGLVAIGGLTFAVVAAVFFMLNGRTEKPDTRTKYYAETFGPETSKKEYPIEEVLGKVHYLFATNWVRSTPNEENIGLRFEPKSVRPAAFPLRTAFVARELQQDIQDFLLALVSPLVHNLDGAITELMGPEDFCNAEKYDQIKDALLLEIDRMQAMGDLKIDRVPVPLRTIVHSVCAEFGKTHPFFLSSAIDDQVDQAEEFKVYAQKELLENAVRVLFSNAARAVFRRIDQKDQAYTPMVRYELHQDGHRVVLSVIDNGGGFSRAVEERLFEPFTTGESDEGHGLGLFYADTVAKAWEGRLMLVRNDKNETQFDLILHSVEEVKHESGHVSGE